MVKCNKLPLSYITDDHEFKIKIILRFELWKMKLLLLIEMQLHKYFTPYLHLYSNKQFSNIFWRIYRIMLHPYLYALKCDWRKTEARPINKVEDHWKLVWRAKPIKCVSFMTIPPNLTYLYYKGWCVCVCVCHQCVP